MGLMSLIARKLKLEKSQPRPRALPYESKISSKSPVRLVQVVSESDDAPEEKNSSAGARPVESAEAPALPLLDHLRESSLALSSGREAPEPVVPGLRGDDGPNRLSSRPTTSSGPGTRLSLLASPLPRAGLLARSRPETPANIHSHRARSSISSSRYNTGSVRNVSTGRPHIDLLDAQSEFRPLDFYGRVKASGARDYGEDVADRNINANSAHQDLQPRQADYTLRQPFSSWCQQAPIYDEESEAQEAPGPTPVTLHAIEMPAVAGLKNKKVLNRQTLQFGSPTDLGESSSTATLAELRAILGQQDISDKKRRRLSLQISVNEDNRIVRSQDAASPDNRRPTTPTGLRSGLSKSSEWSTAFPSIFEISKKSEKSDETLKYAVNNQPVLSPQPTSFHLSSSWATSALAAPNNSVHNVQSVKSSQQHLQATLEALTGMTDPTSQPNHTREREMKSKPDWHNDTADRECAPSPCIRTSRSRSQSGDSVSMQGHYRTKDTATPQPGSSLPTETEEHTPGLTSSTRHWSLSSSTPTTSSLSPALYGRPQSRNTTANSLDLGTMGLANPSLKPILGDFIMGQLSGKDVNSGPSLLPSSEPFNIDDYVSDDSDSFVDGHLERTENEEPLLFSSGYGMNSTQLPGLGDLGDLGDMFSAPAPAPSISDRGRRRTRSMSKVSPAGDIETCLDFADLASVNDIVLAYPALDDDEDDEDDDFLSPQIDVGRYRRSPGPAEHLLRAASSFHHHHHPGRLPSLGRSQTPTRAQRAHSPTGSTSSRRSETKRLTAICGPTSSPSASSTSGSVPGRHSLRFRSHPHPSHQHLVRSNSVGQPVIEEERSDDKGNIATAVRLHKPPRVHTQASMVGASTAASSYGMYQAVSIEALRVVCQERHPQRYGSSRAY